MTLTTSTSATSTIECTSKYQTQTDHLQTIPAVKIHNTRRKSDKQNHRKKKVNKKKRKYSTDDGEDDFMHMTKESNVRDYVKDCIKRRLYNNYEKQRNSALDDNIVFTDNKIYVSLARRNSSLSSSFSGTNSLSKNRRIIYPTRNEHKRDGFLRNYDFNYESPKRRGENSGYGDKRAMHQGTEPVFNGKEVLFEKVKIQNDKKNSLIPVTLNSDSNIFDDEDDAQFFEDFMKLRQQEIISKNNQMALIDNAFDSQFFENRQNLSEIHKNEKYVEESFDNSFNEQLEHKASIIKT